MGYRDGHVLVEGANIFKDQVYRCFLIRCCKFMSLKHLIQLLQDAG